jgi:hypothetical protein
MGRVLQPDSDDARAFEQVLEDIQLLGSKVQVEMAIQIIDEMNAGSEADPNDLLLSLRSDLRDALGLEAFSVDKIKHLRVKAPAGSS